MKGMPLSEDNAIVAFAARAMGQAGRQRTAGTDTCSGTGRRAETFPSLPAFTGIVKRFSMEERAWRASSHHAHHIIDAGKPAINGAADVERVADADRIDALRQAHGP